MEAAKVKEALPSIFLLLTTTVSVHVSVLTMLRHAGHWRQLRLKSQYLHVLAAGLYSLCEGLDGHLDCVHAAQFLVVLL